MRVSIFGVIVSLVLAIPGTAGWAGSGEFQTRATETFVCRGPLQDAVPFSPLAGRGAVDMGWFYLSLDEAISPKDSVYIHEIADLILPSLAAVLGPPPEEVDTLRLVLVLGGGAVSRFEPFMIMPTIHHARGADDDHDGRIDQDPLDGFDNDGDGRIDEDLTYHRAWEARAVLVRD